MKLWMGCTAGWLLLTGCLLAQDRPMAKEGMMMSKEAMMAKKKLMEPAMRKDAEMSLMGDKSMVPTMVAKEMVQHEVMHDKGVMQSMEKMAMMKDAGSGMMADGKAMVMAREKMIHDPQAMTMLFQELVARHIAAKKMSMLMKADPKMESMEGKQMKLMMMNSDSMMMAKKALTADMQMMMMARESLVQSLMQDEEVMKMVDQQAAMQMDPKMSPMLDAKVKAASEMLMKDREQSKGMMQQAMTRSSMMMDQKKMMKDDPKLKK